MWKVENLRRSLAMLSPGAPGLSRDDAMLPLELLDGADVGLAARRCSSTRTWMTEAADADRMIATAVDTYGRLDVLFNNAGVEGPSKRLLDYGDDN